MGEWTGVIYYRSIYCLLMLMYIMDFIIPGGPPKNGTVDFLGLCSDQQLSFFTLLDRTSFPHIITPRSSNSVENFLFYE